MITYRVHFCGYSVYPPARPVKMLHEDAAQFRVSSTPASCDTPGRRELPSRSEPAMSPQWRRIHAIREGGLQSRLSSIRIVVSKSVLGATKRLAWILSGNQTLVDLDAAQPSLKSGGFELREVATNDLASDSLTTRLQVQGRSAICASAQHIRAHISRSAHSRDRMPWIGNPLNNHHKSGSWRNGVGRLGTQSRELAG